uniref:Uncharacterized protein n=1 Tax=Panagrolaimus sp. ES5 TaxID=591445 RepID=A0AC34F1G3_9BILA
MSTINPQGAINSSSTRNGDFQHPQPLPASSSSSTSSTLTQSFEIIFEEFLQKFLETEPSKLDDYEIRAFTLKIPKTYFVLEDRYPTIFKVLFKIKEIQNRAVYNDSLALIERCFTLLDYNKFLFNFWSCDEFKGRDLGPLGYSFTDGRHRCDFSDVRPHDDLAIKNVKVIEVAWSMLLDIEATVDFLINSFIDDRPMAIYFAIILRRFKCLGDYKIKLDNKEVPIFIYFFRKAHHRSITSGHFLSTILSCLVTVTWTPKSSTFGWCLMKPNYALSEIMANLVLDDEKQPKYILALQRLFKPFDNFWCNIEWNSDSQDFDNPSLFLFHLIKYFNGKNTVEFNNEIFGIIESFKKSLSYRGTQIQNFDIFEENFQVDWPFAYGIFECLEVQHLKRHISASIFKSLPATAAGKYISMEESNPSLEKALTGIFELYFICRSSRAIPDAFYKDLMKTYDSPKSFVDTIAQCVVQAYNNLKHSYLVKADIKFIDFLSRICEFCFDIKIFDQFACMVEMNTDIIHQCIHLVIVGRVIRLMLEEKFIRDTKKPTFTDMNDFVQDLFKAFGIKVYNKFGELKIANKQLWPPWRKGNAPSVKDETTMAINHVLNAIQKEAYCIYDNTYGFNADMLEFLFQLYKERRHFGLTFSKLDQVLRNTYPRYFEELDERMHDRRPPPPQQSSYGRNDSESRQSRQGSHQPRHEQQQPRHEQQQPRYEQQTFSLPSSYPMQQQQQQQRNYGNENFDSQNSRGNYRGGYENRSAQQNSQRNGSSSNDVRSFNNSAGSYRNNSSRNN